jgi:hypothetical protein
MRLGEGRIKVGIEKTRQAASHAAIMMTNNIVTEKRLA